MWESWVGPGVGPEKLQEECDEGMTEEREENRRVGEGGRVENKVVRAKIERINKRERVKVDLNKRNR